MLTGAKFFLFLFSVVLPAAVCLLALPCSDTHTHTHTSRLCCTVAAFSESNLQCDSLKCRHKSYFLRLLGQTIATFLAEELATVSLLKHVGLNHQASVSDTSHFVNVNISTLEPPWLILSFFFIKFSRTTTVM